MRGNLLSFFVRFLVVFLVIALTIAVNWILDGSHIKTLVENDIPLRFEDGLLWGIVSFKWWGILFVVVVAGVITAFTYL